MSSDAGPQPGLVVISGPSGSGKTTICNLLAQHRDFVPSISDTTRSPRPGEVEGREYRFISRAEFEQRIARGRYLEHAEVYGQLYGTPKEGMERARANGRHLLLNIDPQGARALQKQGIEGTYIFLMPPSLEVLKARLVARRTDDAAEIARRLAEAEAEIAQAHHYDHQVVNDKLARTVAEIRSLLGAGGEKRRNHSTETS